MDKIKRLMKLDLNHSASVTQNYFVLYTTEIYDYSVIINEL